MSTSNGNRQIENKIADKFVQTFNIYHLYEFCYKIYKTKEPQLHRKYSNLFSYINLMNTRSVMQEKQAQFIKEWKSIIQTKNSFNFMSHIQELIKLLEIINERIRQAQLFIKFLNDLTLTSWPKLESTIIGTLMNLRINVANILKGLLQKHESKMNKQIKKEIQFIIETPQKLPNKIRTQPAEEQKLNLLQTVKEMEDAHPKGSGNVSGPCQVHSIKFFFKERPTPIKLLTNEQVQSLRKQIAQRIKSNTFINTITTEGSVRGRQSNNMADHKQKFQNLNTYQTEISQNSDEQGSKEKPKIRNSNSLLKVKDKDKNKAKHHKSNLQNQKNVKNLFQIKESNKKYKSIHKIQGISSVGKYHRSTQEPPSRNTIQSGSINRFVSFDTAQGIDSKIKNMRVNKISIMGKLQRTIKKIQIRDLKKPRGGLYIPDDQLKEIQEMYRETRQNKDFDKKNADDRSDSDSISSYNSTNQKEGDSFNDKLMIQDKRISQFLQFASQKEHKKYKRRFGVSTKGANSSKSIDSHAQIKTGDKYKPSDPPSRTSIFRSSGSNFQERKKSLIKSRYHRDSNRKTRFNKDQGNCYDQRDSKEFQQMAKKYALSKKSNQKPNIEGNIFNVDKKALVSSQDMFKVLFEIHEQDKLDRSTKYEDYYDEILRRKYQGHSKNLHQDTIEKGPTSIKMENRQQERPSTKLRNIKRQSILFDLMMKTIKMTQKQQLQQIGISIAQQ